MGKLKKNFNLEEYNYFLPDEKIAKYPLEKRDNSKLLIYQNSEIISDFFYNIQNYFTEKILIIFNDTKVINARILFEKETGSKIEIFCLEPIYPSDYYLAFSQKNKCSWKCFVGNNKKWKSGIVTRKININEIEIILTATRISEIGNSFEIEFSWNNPEICFSEILNTIGEIPIPPYLNRNSEDIDKSRYQTVYSKFEGSVAAPTAGLHFTKNILDNLKSKNNLIDNVTLHIGAGTFQPIKSNNISEHLMHREKFIISKSTLQNIIENFGNICAVGTTSVRTLESMYQIGNQIYKNGNINNNLFFISQFEAYDSKKNNVPPIEILKNLLSWMKKNNFSELHCETQIMIIPGYDFKIVNKIITNFHQPKSTLLLLISAFIGEKWEKIYDYALKNDFRFLSYGDCCLLEINRECLE